MTYLTVITRLSLISLLIIVTLAIVACSYEKSEHAVIPPRQLVWEHHIHGDISEIRATNCDGTRLKTIVNGLEPIVSPNGRWLAFTRVNSKSGRTDLYLVDRQLGGVRLLRRSAAGIMWTRGSRLLVVYGATMSPIRTIATIDPIDAKWVELISGPVAYPMLNPSGDEMVYKDELKGDIYVLTTWNGHKRRLTSHGKSRFAVIGSKYISVSEEASPGSVTTLVRIYAKASEHARSVPVGKSVAKVGGMEPILWLNDGVKLLMGTKADEGGYRSIEMLDAKTMESRRLYRVGKPFTAFDIRLSENGTSIVFTEEADRRRPRIRIVSIQKPRTIRVIQNARQPSWNCK